MTFAACSRNVHALNKLHNDSDLAWSTPQGVDRYGLLRRNSWDRCWLTAGSGPFLFCAVTTGTNQRRQDMGLRALMGLAWVAFAAVATFAGKSTTVVLMAVAISVAYILTNDIVAAIRGSRS